MHIAEGVLSAPVLIAGAAVAAAGIAVGLKRLDESRLMTAGLVGAAFFIASLIHVPIGVSSAHLLLCGLVGVMLGVSAYPVIFTALLLQGVLFEFGGLTVLGVNTATMGTGALTAGMLFPCVGSPRRVAPAIDDCWRFSGRSRRLNCGTDDRLRIGIFERRFRCFGSCAPCGTRPHHGGGSRDYRSGGRYDRSNLS